MAATWWSKRFTAVLESFGLGGRMTRGRTYARQGQVLALDVDAGLLIAQVQGSRRTPYAVTVRLTPPTSTQWIKIEDLLRARVGYAATLLAGEVPTDLESLFAEAGCALFPSQWRDLKATCSCPDWGDPCKHQAAVLYVFADQLDSDPWRLLMWHGRSRDDLLGLFARGAASDEGDAHQVVPWWPLRPGAPIDSSARNAALTPSAVMSAALIATGDDPGAVLRRVGELDAVAGGRPISESISRAYKAVTVPDSIDFGADGIGNQSIPD
jgi:uncharacterized Zn finger protein